MTTVIAVYNSAGCVGRCDARCHEAKSAECDCICGGANHGAGLKQAMQNNADRVGLKSEDLERFAKEHGMEPKDLAVIDRVATPKNGRAAKEAARALRNQRWLQQRELDLSEPSL
jgi:hypothetical protein